MISPSLLTRYIFREMNGPFWASLLIVVAIIGLGQLLQLMELVFSLNIGGADFIRVCAYIVPKILMFGLPMAGGLATIIAFNRLSSDNEIMVMRACGIGLAPMLVPVLLFALLTGGLAAWTTTSLAPAATVNMKRLLIKLARNRLAAGIRPGVFVDAIHDVVIHVGRIDPESGTLHRVYLNDLRNPAAPMAISAESGELVPDLKEMRVSLHLKKGTSLRLGRDTGQAVSFATYDLSVPVDPPRVINGTSVDTVDEGGFSMGELAAGIKRLGGDNKRGRELRAELHRRLALPVGCFLLTMVGISLGMSAGPGRRPPGLAAGLGLFIAYYLLLSAAKSTAEAGRIPMLAALWGPNLLLACLTGLLLFITGRGHHLPGFGELFSRLWAVMGRRGS